MADPFDDSVLTGMDTTAVRPIELQLDVINDQKYGSGFTRSSTMYILLHHDLLVMYTNQGVVTVGTGWKYWYWRHQGVYQATILGEIFIIN